MAEDETNPATPEHLLTAADSLRRALPRWQCHKIVSAAPIIERRGNVLVLDLGGGKRAPVHVAPALFARYAPQPGDYLVLYRNDYLSISPKAEFDDGYYRL